MRGNKHIPLPSGWEQSPSTCSLCCKSDLSHPSQLPVTSVQSRNPTGHSILPRIIPLAKSKLATLQVTSFHSDLPVPVCPTVPFSWELLTLAHSHDHPATSGQGWLLLDGHWTKSGPSSGPSLHHTSPTIAGPEANTWTRELHPSLGHFGTGTEKQQSVCFRSWSYHT